MLAQGPPGGERQAVYGDDDDAHMVIRPQVVGLLWMEGAMHNVTGRPQLYSMAHMMADLAFSSGNCSHEHAGPGTTRR